MSVKRSHPETECLYFITFTCFHHFPLFDQTNLYEFICDQFRLLHKEHYKICGFVIMPNHLHFLLFVPANANLSKRIGTMKRFMAYEIVKRCLSSRSIIQWMRKNVNHMDLSKGKIHQVFEPSFDARLCFIREMADQKLQYIHHNPCKGKWNLAYDYTRYKWSSAYFYEYGKIGSFDFLSRYEDYV